MVGKLQTEASRGDEEDVQYDICSDYVTNDAKAVTCDECNIWFHQGCGKVTNAIFNKIEKAPRSNPYYLSCDECRRNKKKKGSKLGVSKKSTCHNNKYRL